MLVCFIFNTALSDLAFGQELGSGANSYNLAAHLKPSSVLTIGRLPFTGSIRPVVSLDIPTTQNT